MSTTPNDSFPVERTAARKIATQRSPQSNNKLIKKTNEYIIEVMTFANSTISNLDNTNSIVNRLRSASHRKHRARTKQHLRELILDLHVRWKSPPTGDTKVDKTKPIIPQLHKIQSQSQIHRNVPHCPPSPTTKMPSKKAKKSRKDAQVRQRKKKKRRRRQRNRLHHPTRPSNLV